MLRRVSAVLLSVALLCGVSASVAAASGQTVLQAIKAQDKIIHSNPTYKSLKNLKINTAAEAKAAIPKFKELATLADNAASAVSKASATSAQKAGQKDWVIGVRDVAGGVNDLAISLQDLVTNNKTAAKAESVKADKLVAYGNAIGSKGDKLLHLPTSD